MRSAKKACRFPFDRRKLTGNARLRLALSMPARQANCSDLPNVSLLRDIIFAHRKPAGDNRSSAVVTGICREVKVLCSHLCPLERGETTTKRKSLTLKRSVHNCSASRLRRLDLRIRHASLNSAGDCPLPGHAASSFFLVSCSRVFLGARAFTASIILRVNGFRLS